MATFNEANLEKIIERYIRDFDDVRYQEIYKWEALYCFKQHWNLDAPDFAAMLESAFAKEVNLLKGGNYYPKGMLIEMARLFPTELKGMVVALLNEGVSLRQRLQDFSDAADMLLVELNKNRAANGLGTANSHFQDARAMSVYLAFANTEMNYLYKTSMYRKLAGYLEVDIPANKFERPVAYRSLCDEILGYLEDHHPDLIERSDNALPPEYVDADPRHHILVQDIVYYADAYMRDDVPASDTRRYWIYAPGENASAWNDCLEQGIMVLGWDEIGDFAQYGSREEITEKMNEVYGLDSTMTNASLACWQFQNEIQLGDIVFAKQGTQLLIGKGVVKSSARFDPSREHYTQVRDVEWLACGSWTIADADIPMNDGTVLKQLPMKTLTEWTMYPDAIAAVERLISGEIPLDREPEAPAYWFLVANPKIWSFSDIEAGEEQFYTLYNEKGNPRRIQKNFLAAKPGDIIVGYESQPVMNVVAICEVSRDHDDKNMYFRKLHDVQGSATYQQFKEDPVLSTMEFMRNYSGSMFALTAEEYGALEELMNPEQSPIESEPDPYTDDDFYNEVFIGDGELDVLKGLLERKKNIILQGAPGTGKTYAARRLAWACMGLKDNSRVQQVQFHQNTTYDDFVYGYRPNEGGGFETRPGVFTEFCRRAASRPEEPFFFIIDEINRANISKVFGELLMLIEYDHRGESVMLPISGERFAVPDNVYVIGMMNTADRGLALIDYALRRRFAFYEMEPVFDNERFRRRAEQAHPDMLKLVDAVKDLNETIAKDASLGRGFRIGYSYFCPGAGGASVDPKSVFKYEIKPLIEEYWFDNEDRAKQENDKLEKAVQ